IEELARRGRQRARASRRPPGNNASQILRSRVTTVTVGTQVNAEDRTPGRIVLDQEPAAVGIDDRVADGQPDTQPVDLGREERLEDPAEIGFPGSPAPGVAPARRAPGRLR